MARLVRNHNTNIEGLIYWLKSMSKENRIQTITPGPISHKSGKSNKLTIKVSTKTITGFKLIARKGSSTQEVYIVTKLDRIDLINIIARHNPNVKTKQ